MAKADRITRKAEYSAVFAGGRSWGNRFLVMRALPNGWDLTRHGIITSKKLGKAVVRNKVKRRLREIVRQMPVKGGWDLVFIARPIAAQVEFQDLSRGIRELLGKAHLLEGE